MSLLRRRHDNNDEFEDFGMVRLFTNNTNQQFGTLGKTVQFIQAEQGGTCIPSSRFCHFLLEKEKGVGHDAAQERRTQAQCAQASQMQLQFSNTDE